MCSVSVSVRKSAFSFDKRIDFEDIRCTYVGISYFLCVFASRRWYTCLYARHDFVRPAWSISRIPQHSVGWNQESIVQYE